MLAVIAAVAILAANLAQPVGAFNIVHFSRSEVTLTPTPRQITLSPSTIPITNLETAPVTQTVTVTQPTTVTYSVDVTFDVPADTIPIDQTPYFLWSVVSVGSVLLLSLVILLIVWMRRRRT
jgi:hypothetical protein